MYYEKCKHKQRKADLTVVSVKMLTIRMPQTLKRNINGSSLPPLITPNKNIKSLSKFPRATEEYHRLTPNPSCLLDLAHTDISGQVGDAAHVSSSLE